MVTQVQTFNPADIFEIPTVMALPRHVEDDLFRALANAPECSNLSMRVQRPTDLAHEVVREAKFTDLSESTLLDWLDDLSDSFLGTVECVLPGDLARLVFGGDAGLRGFVARAAQEVDLHEKPLGRETTVLPSADMGLSLCLLAAPGTDVACWEPSWKVARESYLPEGMALQTEPGNLEVILYRGTSLAMRRTGQGEHGPIFEITLALRFRLHVRRPGNLIAYKNIATFGTGDDPNCPY